MILKTAFEGSPAECLKFIQENSSSIMWQDLQLDASGTAVLGYHIDDVLPDYLLSEDALNPDDYTLEDE